MVPSNSKYGVLNLAHTNKNKGTFWSVSLLFSQQASLKVYFGAKKEEFFTCVSHVDFLHLHQYLYFFGAKCLIFPAIQMLRNVGTCENLLRFHQNTIWDNPSYCDNSKYLNWTVDDTWLLYRFSSSFFKSFFFFERPYGKHRRQFFLFFLLLSSHLSMKH